MELQLTDFIVSEMKREGSTYYRPEACQDPEVDEAGKPDQPEPQAKKKNKKNKSTKEEGAEGAEKKEEEVEEPPKKKTKKSTAEADNDEAQSDGESLPW